MEKGYEVVNDRNGDVQVFSRKRDAMRAFNKITSGFVIKFNEEWDENDIIAGKGESQDDQERVASTDAPVIY